MNIFILDECPIKAAQYQNNKHVVKMILETAQMMSTAVILTGGSAPYKATHKNHPCNVWARKTKANFNWLKHHGIALCREYTYRYNKVHKSEAVIRGLTDATIPEGEITPFALAMPDQYKSSNAVEAYRSYYNGEKASISKWTKREQPKWFVGTNSVK